MRSAPARWRRLRRRRGAGTRVEGRRSPSRGAAGNAKGPATDGCDDAVARLRRPERAATLGMGTSSGPNRATRMGLPLDSALLPTGLAEGPAEDGLLPREADFRGKAPSAPGG